MNIAICDDDQKDRDTLHSYLIRYTQNNSISAEFSFFNSGEEFLQHKDVHFDVVFMDIYMEGMNGLDTAKSISDKSSKFVFTTTSPDFSLSAFAVNVVHYLLKPVTFENISEAMERCFPQQAYGLIYLKKQKITIPVSQADIIFIEVFNNTLIVHTVHEEIEVRMTLKTIFDMLNKNIFIQPQRSYIVNMNYIDDFTTDSIRLTNGNEIFMSKEQRAKTLSLYETFLFEKVRKGRTSR